MPLIQNAQNYTRCSAAIYIDNGFPLDYLRYLFPRDKETGHYIVSSTTLVGSVATNLAEPALLPVELPKEKGKTAVILDLPTVAQLPRNRWMQYSRTDMIRINEILTDCFELDFYRYYLKGIQFGYEKKEVVETYVISRNLVTGEPFDTLHKRVFRKEMEIMSQKVEQLRRKAKYFFDEADPNPIQSK